MHDLAIVSEIESIRPIEGRDRIEMARIENYNSAVSKGAYKPGDLAVYVFYDSILPADNPDFDFLRERCYSTKLDGYRIRPIKMGEEISEGLILPLTVLPPGKDYKKGDIVTADLKIRLYEPPEEATPQNVVGPYPTLISKADEENIEKVFYNREKWKDLEFYVTEKIEGSAGTWIYNAETDEFHIYSHNWEVGESGVWFDAARNEKLKDKMKFFCTDHEIPSLVIQGEVIAPSIQKNIYKVSRAQIYVYGIMDADGKRFIFEDLRLMCMEMGLKMVPILSESEILPDSLDELLASSEGRSCLFDVPREGVVWRSATPYRDVHFKVKSRPYKVWFDKRK